MQSPVAHICICMVPGLQKLAGVEGGEDAVNSAVAACIPVGHVGAKWDIAIAAVFLASPAARFISGAPCITKCTRISHSSCILVSCSVVLRY